MGRKIELQVGDQIAIAELMEDEAPKTCEAVWSALPCRGNLIHAKMAGAGFFIKIPIFVDPENRNEERNEGNIAYWDTGQTICVFYENIHGAGDVNTFARITENLAGIKEEGLKGWKKQGAPIEIRRKGGN